MSKQIWMEALGNAQGDGSALSNSTTATSILPAPAKVGLYANYFDQIGKALRITAAGRVSNIVTTPGTLTLDVRMGPTSNIVVFNGGAMQLSTTAHTNVPWYLEVLLTLRALGSGTSANLMGQGLCWSQALSISGADPTTGHSFLMIPNTAPAVGTGFDSTSAMIIDLFAAFSIANAGNAITCHQFLVESLN